MKRNLEKLTKGNLVNNDLWKNKLKQDCLDKNVFLAIRDDNVGFYHEGGKLFGLDSKGFKTHFKFASVIDPNNEKDSYLTKTDLSELKLISDFEKGYSQIKENCSNYSGVEAKGVSKLYSESSYLSGKNVVVLDIEVSFATDDDEKTQDRIDIVLLNTKNKKLLFVEAKHFSNGEIWSTSTPKVIKQLDKYKKQIIRREKEILEEYSKYVDIINELFVPSQLLPKPTSIDDKKVVLLIFGFDKNQKEGRLKELIKENPAYKGVNCYFKGNIEKTDLEKTIWKAKEL